MIALNTIKAAAAFGLAAAIAPLHASEVFPNKAVRIVVNFGAGGSTDIASRIVAKRMSQELGQPVVVENRPGATGTLGPAYVAKQPADGYTIGLTPFGAMVVGPWMVKVSYKTSDFDYLGAFSKYRFGLVVNADTPYKTIGDILSAGKKSNQPLLFGTPGPATNLIFPMLTRTSGVKFEQVMYKSGTEAALAVVANQVPMSVSVSTEVLSQLQAGKLRLIASVTSTRWPEYPDVPTAKEAGFDALIESFLGMAVPKGTPADRLEKLRAAFKTTMADPSVRDELNRVGMEPAYLDGPTYDQLVEVERQKMGEQIRALGVPLPSQ
ncbi:tripartite tricarboxylate transporter substrate binding protein [Pseudorhodoferax soli]|uniref:Tripartite-type tricarboxylate transporter receptor subunit TctC n=1 Tax=Pseudorhodoferax soli TaxID=545864 RepID=A0A368XRK8_9BURK|nr:tripartite tricarboxylate transporter substrate binding protein [Pseudorhodoferax soli]RCW68644.1 tripartite-type tricarboxylate transporter receptor subunit TctC [Pseudorhodoferax soli]